MLNIRKKYATNADAETKGTWREIGEGASLLVARTGNPAYATMLSSLYEQHRLVLEPNDEAANAKSDAIMIEVMSKTILLGWKGVADDDGSPLEYSHAAAAEQLKIKDFRRLVAKLADEFEAYRLHKDDAQGKP